MLTMLRLTFQVALLAALWVVVVAFDDKTDASAPKDIGKASQLVTADPFEVVAAKKKDVVIKDKEKCPCDCGCADGKGCDCKKGHCKCKCGCSKDKACSCNDGWKQSEDGVWFYFRAGKSVAAFDPETGKYFLRKGKKWVPWEDKQSMAPAQSYYTISRGC